MRHSRSGSGHSGTRAALLGLWLCAAVATAAPAPEPAPRASVVWASGDRAYLASPDSGALLVGARVSVLWREDTLATGVVTAVLDGAVAAVQLDRGLSHPGGELASLGVRLEPPRLHVPRRLSIGLPAGARGNAIVACARMSLDSVFTAEGYLVERLGTDSYLGLRDSSRALPPAWPDTLLVRTFRDATDEEIALERGELDLAVFWPGERSERLRADPRWRDSPVPVRSLGLIVARQVGSGPGAPAPRAADLIEAMGRGGAAADLVPLAPREGSASEAPVGATPERAGVRYLADASLPGQRAIQRALDRDGGTATARGSLWSVSVIEAAVTAADSIAAEGRVVPLLAIGCPVVCRAGLRTLVDSLGAQRFADAMVCRRGERWP